MGQYAALIQWLFQLQGPSLKWDLDTARALAGLLGHPERRFRSVHIAGTNAKGSVAAMIHAIGLAAGVRVGLNTSPHLVDVRERIRIGEHELDEQAFMQLIEELRQQIALALPNLPRHPSFFEVVTAAAMVAFARQQVELAVIETGLGGRLDATNLVVPQLSVITTIGLDHQVTLGGSIESIAREKAGIIKPGVPVLVGWVPEPALAVIRARAHALGAPLHLAARELAIDVHLDGAFDLQTPLARYRRLESALEGRHQRQNAALAIRAAELLRQRGFDLPERAIVRGLSNTRWPGRMETLPGRPSVLLDGAHNIDGALALGTALRDRYRVEPRRRVLLFGVTAGRDAAALFAPLQETIAHVIVCTPPIAKAQPAEAVADALRQLTARPIEIAASAAEGIQRARWLAGPDGEVVVAGSLYLVGDVRRLLLGSEPPAHPQRELVPPVVSATEPRQNG
jgi:dihydrofolate synthase/folylpolyglutamate synthase